MTLTEASFWTKRFGVIGGAALLIILTIIIIVVYTGNKPSIPQEYLLPNYGCTEKAEEFLQKAKIEIPSLEIDPNSEAVFNILTPTGKINELPSVVNVYKFENPTQSWSSQAYAKVLAGNLGFDKEKIIIEDIYTYKWRDNVNLRTLVVNAKNLNFTLETDPQRIRNVSDQESLPSEQSAKSTAQNILRTKGLLDNSSEYSFKITKTTYINLNADGTFSKALSASEAELIKVDFSREKSMITFSSELVGTDKMIKDFTASTGTEPQTVKRTINDKSVEFYTFDTRVVLPKSQDSNISVYIGPEDKKSKLSGGLTSTYKIDYTYWPISFDPCGTYPLIPTATAVNEVSKGNGSIAYLYEKDGDDISGYRQKNVKQFRINTNVKILYYETPEEQDFLVPIYLISGEAVFNDDTTGLFDIYYPAIDYNNIKDKVIQKQIPVEEKKNSFL
ncbi:MAG: hypothetical protein ACOX0R_01580 [Candidatus Dojkabacteria bacterium]|jgi:hypothetical protein